VFNFTKSFQDKFSNVNHLVALKAITAVLIVSPLIAQAESQKDSNLLNLIAISESNAAELGSVVADDHWTRIEFSKVYVDPVVVIESDANAVNNTYIAGIRNIDTKGFEINLKSCNNTTEIPLQETINYSVIDNSELPQTSEKNTAIRQPFAWGECAV
jgi:hypothetical protein